MAWVGIQTFEIFGAKAGRQMRGNRATVRICPQKRHNISNSTTSLVPELHVSQCKPGASRDPNANHRMSHKAEAFKP